MAFSREEQLRSSRRLARQLVGAAVVLLVVIGLVTVIGWAVGGVRRAFDDSDRKEAYADRLYGMVLFDALAFDDVSAVDQNVFKQAAIWGTVYEIQKNGGSLDGYERDEATGCVILPKLEVNTYITNLLGTDYQIKDGAFETAEMNYLYDEEKQGYLVPVTGSVGAYTPQVARIATKGGKTYVTVGYIPTMANSNSLDLTLTAPTEPTKYMDYVFSRGENRQWYLTALQESEMQPAASSAAAGQQADSVLLQDPQALVESALNGGDSAAAESTPEPTEEQPAEENAEAPAEEAAPAESEEGAANADAESEQPAA